jgi:hypothetical protein
MLLKVKILQIEIYISTFFYYVETLNVPECGSEQIIRIPLTFYLANPNRRFEFILIYFDQMYLDFKYQFYDFILRV